MSGIITPGYVRWDGFKYVTDPTVEIVGPPGPPSNVPGPAGPEGPQGPTGPAGQPGTALGGTGNYSCSSSVTLLSAVYSDGYNSLDGYGIVAFADSSVTNKIAIGIVNFKPTTTTAIVQYSGEIIGFNGTLTTSATYYLSTSGAITTTAPTAAGHVVQILGFAKDTNTLVLEINRNVVFL